MKMLSFRVQYSTVREAEKKLREMEGEVEFVYFKCWKIIRNESHQYLTFLDSELVQNKVSHNFYYNKILTSQWVRDDFKYEN